MITDVCNIFKPLSNQTGNFLLFSQYTNDLAKSTTDSNYKVRPSHFYCLDLSKDVIINTINYFPNETNLNKSLPNYFQNYFECGLSLLRTNNSIDPEDNFAWNKVDVPFMTAAQLIYNINELTSPVSSTLPPQPFNINDYFTYKGDIDLESWENGFADIIISIPAGSSRKKFKIQEDIEGNLQTTNDINNAFGIYANNEITYILGWSNVESIPLNGTVQNLKCVRDNNGSIFYEKNEDSVFDILFNYKDINTENPDITFNVIIPCYDIEIGSSETETSYYKDIPMGIYFTGICGEDGIEHPITIQKTNDDALGAGSSWALRICTKFAPTPHGVIKVENVAVESGVVSNSLSAIMSANAEMIKAVNDMSKKSWTETESYRNLLNIFKNSKTNVPYPLKVNGIDYWFVNGRNTGIPCTAE